MIAPETTIDKAPKEKLKTRRKKALVRFRFSSTEPSGFRCRLDDRPERECVSPYLNRVKPGRHTFTVQATDVAGNLDPTPASAGFKLKRRGAPIG